MADTTLIGATDFRNRLKAVGNRRLILGMVATQAVAEAKLLVPRQTGNLGRTIRVGRVTDGDAEVRAGGTAKVGYAAYVEFGTGPHIIRPVRAKVLAWPATAAGRRLTGSARSSIRRGFVAGLGGSGGVRLVGSRRGKSRRSGPGGATNWRYAMVVHHPGTRPKPYLVPGVKAALAKAWPEVGVKAWNEAA